jgi:hypothetical protein
VSWKVRTFDLLHLRVGTFAALLTKGEFGQTREFESDDGLVSYIDALRLVVI